MAEVTLNKVAIRQISQNYLPETKQVSDTKLGYKRKIKPTTRT